MTRPCCHFSEQVSDPYSDYRSRRSVKDPGDEADRHYHEGAIKRGSNVQSQDSGDERPKEEDLRTVVSDTEGKRLLFDSLSYRAQCVVQQPFLTLVVLKFKPNNLLSHNLDVLSTSRIREI